MEVRGHCKCCGNTNVSVWCCETCISSWCHSCNQNLRATLFLHGKEEMCSFCCPKDMVFKCLDCRDGECASSECYKVGKYDQIFSKTCFGKCCAAYGDLLCKGCINWEARRTCVAMIGVRKFKKSTLLRTLPRDVLIYALVKPFVWEERGKRDPFKQLKKLKTK